ncbi:garvicin Q family class II bacteriocin [Lactobacillus bombicola]|uniref:garvicin Q family class II bacteriocin n=1 Tax=Lactobacillus bombicola TaxID=1505723 RepID=UPI001D17B8F2|nr:MULTISPECIES: garvicin Q family class II bacteriocin [Lactobacillus]
MKAAQEPDEYVNLLRAANVTNTGYYPKAKEKWHVVDTTTGSNSYLMQSNHGYYQYVVTRTPWETVGHVIAQGWQDALGSGFGFGSNRYSH